MDLYRDEILDHYRNPRNFGSLRKPTTTASLENPLCGDGVSLQLKIENGRVVDVKFTGRGCAVSTASTSLLTEYIKGKSVREIKKISGGKVLEILGVENLSPARLKCAFLPLEALRKALEAL